MAVRLSARNILLQLPRSWSTEVHQTRSWSTEVHLARSWSTNVHRSRICPAGLHAVTCHASGVRIQSRLEVRTLSQFSTLSRVRTLSGFGTLSGLRTSPDLGSWSNLGVKWGTRSFSGDSSERGSGWTASLWDAAPVHLCEGVLVGLQQASGLPWWLNIVVSTVLVRTVVTLPLAAYQMVVLARVSTTWVWGSGARLSTTGPQGPSGIWRVQEVLGPE